MKGKILKLLCFAAKVLLLAHLIYTVAIDLLYNREMRARNFSRKYSELQINLAPYVYIQWPMFVYRESDMIVLLWNYTKLLVALKSIWPRTSVNFLKNMVIVETAVNIIGGCQCLCYLLDQLTVIAGLMVCQYIKRQMRRQGKHCEKPSVNSQMFK